MVLNQRKEPGRCKHPGSDHKEGAFLMANHSVPDFWQTHLDLPEPRTNQRYAYTVTFYHPTDRDRHVDEAVTLVERKHHGCTVIETILHPEQDGQYNLTIICEVPTP